MISISVSIRMSKPFYITTTLPYVNAEPHIGFATEIIRADIIARWRKLLGEEVFFNTGTDEHGIKIYQKALSISQPIQEYVDNSVKSFCQLKEDLNLSYNKFTRTTDPGHVLAAQEFWRRCALAGDIYKKHYKTKYCSGCEMERHDSEVENGHCFLHPNLELEIIEEENYFFCFSKYQGKLLKLYEDRPDFVLPASRLNEIKKFVENGLQDFSISRLANKMPWGIPVPNDPNHVMYVWFDALVNYISAIGWPFDFAQGKPDTFHKWWVESGGAVQYCGKDNLRQQSAMWQAMLMSVGLPPSKQIIIDGFITSGNQKMSKSLGNVVSPVEVVERYSTDALRYLVAREFSTFEDSDFTWERFKEAYNANLANGLGNLVSRIMKMAETNLETCPELVDKELPSEFKEALENYEIGKATDVIWQKIGELDSQIQKTEPFKLIKTDKEAGIRIIEELIVSLYDVAKMLEPILPDTSAKIQEAIKASKMPAPLFLRKD